MASLAIRKLDENLKKRLRLQAARNGRSMEEDAQFLPATGLKRSARRRVAGNAADAIAELFDPIGGVKLDLPARSPTCDTFLFGSWSDER